MSASWGMTYLGRWEPRSPPRRRERGFFCSVHDEVNPRWVFRVVLGRLRAVVILPESNWQRGGIVRCLLATNARGRCDGKLSSASEGKIGTTDGPSVLEAQATFPRTDTPPSSFIHLALTVAYENQPRRCYVIIKYPSWLYASFVISALLIHNDPALRYHIAPCLSVQSA